MACFRNRMIRAAKLDVQLYEEVEADQGATGQAMTVVILSAAAAGIGSVDAFSLTSFLIGTVGALGAWYVWAFLTYFIGTNSSQSHRPGLTIGNYCARSAFPARRD